MASLNDTTIFPVSVNNKQTSTLNINSSDNSSIPLSHLTPNGNFGKWRAPQFVGACHARASL
jgi:hypothetical protein